MLRWNPLQPPSRCRTPCEGPRVSCLLFLVLLGAFPAQLPVLFLNFQSFLHAFAVPYQVTDFPTVEARSLFSLSSGSDASLLQHGVPFPLWRGGLCGCNISLVCKSSIKAPNGTGSPRISVSAAHPISDYRSPGNDPAINH